MGKKIVEAIGKDIVVTEMNFDEITTSFGLTIPSDDGKDHGIKPRWCKIHAIGPKQKEFKIGQYILVKHGRWTRAVKIDDDLTIQKVDIDDILAVSNEEPNIDDYYFA